MLPVVTGAYARDTAEIFDHFTFDEEAVAEQTRAILEDVQVQLIKVGFVGSPEVLSTIAETATDYPDVPLVVPEVNAEAVDGYKKKMIIANPNCSTAQMVVALKPLHDRARIKRVVVATYQSVSGTGVKAVEELEAQTHAEALLHSTEKALAEHVQVPVASSSLMQIPLVQKLLPPGKRVGVLSVRSDRRLLRRALHSMDRRLETAWAQRAADTPLKSADDALILASIVEKETGRAADCAQIAGVFTNRLRIGMLLQTDPTVIYGLGEKFDGNLRRRDLQTDTPWNTYTRAGLPPTPIAMPGKAALMAAVQPSQTKALYFVARGDGTSHFSASLDEHNRAVNRYQRGQQKP